MKKHRTATVLALAIAGSVLSGCVLPPTQAELATYNAVAPEHRAYVEADPKLDVTAKARRLDLLEAWRIRVGAK